MLWSLRNMPSEEDTMPLTPEQLAQVSTLDVASALAYLTNQAALFPMTVETLAAAALDKAETEPMLAAHWLAIATAVEIAVGNTPARRAQIAYAQARVHVYRGELTVAEGVLRQAQADWQSAGDAIGYSRSLLGLTQILAMQGRYAEAEATARLAVAAATGSDLAIDSGNELESVFANLMRCVAAHHNLATLLLYQERHTDALAEYTQIRQLLVGNSSGDNPTAQPAELLSKLAHSDLNRATALTFLDQPLAAEAALQQAITLFAQLDDSLNLGRSRTNLGRLHLRTGQYAAALAGFEAAFRDLLGTETTIASAELAELRVADELLLEYAMACLVINLLPEARQLLAHCETLFRSATQPYELGQTRYTQGLLLLRTQQWQAAQEALDEATTHFAALQNSFWLNRTRLAQAAVAYARQQRAQARQLLALLLDTPRPITTDIAGAADWDVGTQIEAHLLRLRMAIDEGELDAARQTATVIATLLKGPNDHDDYTRFWPHLALRLQHMLGKIAQAVGDYATARQHLQAAIAQLEGQRATLVVEEVRSAFIDDKSELYADLVQTLFDMAPTDPATVAEAFGVIEQARSRVLLERLLAAMDEPESPATPEANEANTANKSPMDADEQQRLRELREQLHWLYNQIMGESGSRRLDTQISRQLQQTEAALQQVEWRHSSLLAQAQAVDLTTFQQSLAPDQQAIVYAGIHQEILAFLVDRTSVKVYRHLTDVDAIQAAAAELRFQLGRVELDPLYVARHSLRLEARLQQALLQLYQLLVAPLAAEIQSNRLLFVPFGPLHRIPLHALWDGSHYLIERAECSYAPSASLAVFRHQHTPLSKLHAWAGFAISDPMIPAAGEEIALAARHFTQATTYLDAQANRANLWQAAAHTDILHLATHGLFRPDNPFFSALKLVDGWVDVRELYRLPLAARLVVLSACESGVGELAGGDEVVGLARGFLGAGACELIASLWNVHDATAAQLMEHFYRHLVTEDAAIRPATALQAAQCHAIEARQHPYYWASFFVIGA